MKTQKRIWIVGGSSGIGFELVKLCLDSEYKVVVSSRTATTNENLLKLQEQYSENLNLINLDVSLKDTISSCVQKVWQTYEGLDIWFYNAGAYEVMSCDTWSSEKFEKMNEVNYLGIIRVMTAIFPYFQKQKKGQWVWNASISSYFGLPLGGGYSAPKAALVNLAQSIEPELDRFDIKMQIINHGFVKTKLTDKNTFEMPQLMQPEYTAKKIFEAIQNPNRFEIRFPFILSLFLRILRVLPYKISLYLTKKILP